MNKLSTQMKLICRVFVLCFLGAFSTQQIKAQISVSGGSGLSATYTSLTKSDGLFAAINAASQSGNSIVVNVTGNVSDENGAIGLMAGSWSSIVIKPSGGSFTLSGATAAASSSLFLLDGADNVKFDGLNSGGNALTLSNTATILTNTIGFRNDAKDDTLTNCTILGSGSSTTSTLSGTIAILGSTASGGTGNDNLVISNNDIAAAGGNLPTNAIYSAGTNGVVDNSNILINNNTIHDYWNTSISSRAINIDASNANGSNNWTISNNKFYQTATRNFNVLVNTATTSYILFLGTGDNYTITGNKFGFANSSGTGLYTITTPTTGTTSTTTFIIRFQVIHVGGCAITPASIQNNTIAGFSITSGNNTLNANNATFVGINLANASNANVGNINANIIGATTGTGSITVSSNYPIAGAGGGFVGINLATYGSVNISNNSMGAITSTYSTPGIATTYCSVFGINLAAPPASLIINSNTIGNATADNIVAGIAGASGSVGASNHVAGINVFSATNFTVFNATNNIIRNMRCNGSGTSSYTRGIVNGLTTTLIPASVNISGNQVYNLYCNSTAGSVSSGGVAAAGIIATVGLNPIISDNLIYNIGDTCTAATTTGVITAGIVLQTAQNARIFRNKIYGITNNNTGVTAATPSAVGGIIVNGATIVDTVYNNQVSLGTGQTTNTSFVGIWARGAGGDPVNGSYFYHNTVNIAGATGNTTRDTLPSFCFHRGDFGSAARTGIVFVRNNIFTNTRTITSPATAKQFAIGNNFRVAAASATGWTSNNNVLNSATAATVGSHLNADRTFALWQSSISMDANSYSAISVPYQNAQTDLRINTSGLGATNIESRGDPSLGISKDYENDNRPGPTGSVNGGALAPDLGADEIDGTLIAFACNGSTPTSGTASVSPTTISAYGTTVNLSLASPSIGTGITYQWQSSPNNTTWANIVGATTTTYSATPSLAITYYRCVVTCLQGGTAANSNVVNVTGPTPMPAGIYTIDGNATSTTYPSGTVFQTFTAAINILNNNGIAGPVVFNVSGTTYNEQIVINQINGASATNTVTINGNGRLIYFATNTSTVNRGVITLNGADYVTIDNLKIDASGNSVNGNSPTINTASASGSGYGTGNLSFGYGITFTNDANYNTISNSTIAASTTSITIGNTAGIVFSTTYTAGAYSSTGTIAPGNFNNITGNTLIGGYYGMYINGISTSANYYCNGNNITGSILKEFYVAGIYYHYHKNLNIAKSDISRPVRNTTAATSYGIQCGSAIAEGIIVQKNKVHNMFDGFASTHANACTAISSNPSSGGGVFGSEALTVNNVVYNLTGNGNQIGIVVGGNFFKCYHNTIVLDKPSTTTAATVTTYGLQVQFGNVGQDIRNNMVYVSRTGATAKRCIYVVSGTTPVSSCILDYNNYFMPTWVGGADNNLGQYTATASSVGADIAAWRTLVGAAGANWDLNSSSVLPVWTDSVNADYTPKSALVDNLGTSLGVLDDVMNISRPTSVTLYSAPDMGAYEFSADICTDPPTPGISTASVTTTCAGLTFVLSISGNSTGSQQTYQWQSSSNGTSGWVDVSPLAILPSYTINQSSSKYYRCKIQCTSTGTPVYSANVYVFTPTPPTGTFTINKNVAASSTNFQSFTAAINSMACGIAGPVTFNVVAGSGPYNEQISLGAISGTSNTNRIVFNGNGNTLFWNATNSLTRHTIQLNGVSYCTFDNLVIEAKSLTPIDAGIGVFINSNTSNNTISNCTIDVGAGSTTANNTTVNHAGVLMASSQTTGSGTYPAGALSSSNNIITGNTILGGVYSVALGGGSGGGVASGNQITNNNLRDFYYYGVLIQNQNGCVIRGNDFSRPNRISSAAAAYGVYLYNNISSAVVDKNKIHDFYTKEPSSTANFYAISNGPSGGAGLGLENVVTNNLVYNINHSAGKQGLVVQSPYINCYHNTFVFDYNSPTTTSTIYGLYITTSLSNFKVKNNIFYITHAGLGQKRMIQVNAAVTDTVLTQIDYNLYYTNLTDTNIYKFGTNTLPVVSAKTLAAWKAAHTTSQQDANSIAQFVNFKSPSTGDFTPTTVAVNNKGTNIGITTDIIGTTRSNTTPDVGAYEFDILPCNSKPLGGTAFSSSYNACINDNFILDVSGQSSGLGLTYQWQKSTNGTNWTNIGTVLDSSTSLTTSQTIDNYYRVITTCTNTGDTSISTRILVYSPQYVNGTFTIDSSKATDLGTNNFQSFIDAINYISCGINGPVVFNVVNNGYTFRDKLTVPAVFGTSATNTIKFNGNGVTIATTAINTTDRTAFGLSGTDWVTIDNFNIDVSGGATFGTGIGLTNNASNNTISNCIVNVGYTAATTTAGIVISGSLGQVSGGNSGSIGGHNNLITGCTVNGGYYGIALVGNGSFSGVITRDSSNTISNCNIVDFGSWGVYVANQNNAVVRNCDIYRTALRAPNSSGTPYGIYLSGSGNTTTNCLIEKNKIHDFYPSNATNTTTMYAFYSQASPLVGNENKMFNNLAYNFYNAGTNYGFYSSSGTGMKFYHNTIVFDGAFNNTSHTLYVSGSNIYGVDIRNNMFYVNKSGTGTKRAVNIPSSTTFTGSGLVINNNNYYFNATNGTDNRFGNIGTTTFFNAFTDWNTTSTYDANSVSVDPLFYNAAGGNFTPTTTALNTVGASNTGVTDDIIGNTRSTYFIPGCYEVDNIAPIITTGTLSSVCGSGVGGTSVTVSGVNITDASGVSLTGTLQPRIYFRKNATTYASATGTKTSGTATNSTWSFTINYSALSGGSLAAGEILNYFIVAQDVYLTPNIGSSATGGFTASNVNTVLTYPTAPSASTAQVVTPTVAINTTTTTVCSGNSVMFTAVGTNTGSAPTYQWLNNSVVAGSGSSITFAPNSISNNAQISCVLTSNAACATSTTATSSATTMTVKPSPVVAPVTNGYLNFVSGGVTYCNFGVQNGYYSTTVGGTWSSSNPSVVEVALSSSGSSGSITTKANGTAIVTYSVLSTTGNGCSTAQNINVKVAKEDAPNPITGASTLCVGSNTTFSTTSTGGVWSTTGRASINASTGVATGTSGGATTISYTKTNSDGCKGVVTAPLTVVALPAVPTIGYASGTANPQLGAPSGTFCKGKVFTVVGTPSGGAWTATGAASITNLGGVVTLSNTAGTGSITYTYTNLSGCVSSRSINGIITVSCGPKGINTKNSEIKSSVGFTMYPNPAKNNVNIVVEKVVGEGQIILTDLYGKQISSQVLSLGTNNIDITSLSKGLYIVSVINNNNKSTQKLVVE